MALHNTIEALKQQLQTETDVEKKAHSLYEIASNSVGSNVEEALVYSHKLIELAKAHQLRGFEAAGLATLGFIHLSTAKHEEAQVYISEALEISHEIGDENRILQLRHQLAQISITQHKVARAIELLDSNQQQLEKINNIRGLAHTLYEKGMIYIRLDDNVLALQNLLRAVELMEQVHPEHVGAIYQTIASVYFGIGEPDQALLYLEKGLAVVRIHAPDTDPEALILCNLAHIFVQRGEYEKAVDYLISAQAIGEKLHRIRNLTSIYVELGDVYRKMGEYDKALLNYEKTLQYAEKGQDPSLLSYFLQKISALYSDMGQRSEALLYAERAFEMAQKLNRLSNQAEASRLLSGLYAEAGNTQQAYHYLLEYVKLRDQVLDEEKHKAIAEMQAKFDVQTAEREREIMREKNEELASALDEVRHLNENLTKLDKEKNEVLGIVAHDLKSPISGVRMVALLLAEHCERIPAEELREQLQQIAVASDRMLSISSSLLTAQHIESHNIYGAESEVSIGAMIRDLAESYQSAAEQKGISLQVECDDELVLLCSEEALRQAVENLVSNAVKFTRLSGVVRVRVRSRNRRIVVEVADEGPGISTADKRKLFGKYIRLSARPTGGESSTGLGLWIARKAVMSMQGKIRCTSQMGQGTVFSIELPAKLQTV